jgi:apolipoprotein N-acyltransferase
MIPIAELRDQMTLRFRLLIALIAGGVLPLAFAPVGFWPLGILSPAILLLLLPGLSGRGALAIGFAYGLGQFGVGVSWLYESFTLFGAAVAPLAALITALFVASVSLYPSLTMLLVRVSSGDTEHLLFRHVLAFAGSWTFMEWMRGWIFSGFPWLDLGIAQTNGPLAGFLPVVGEYGVSLIVLVLAGLLALSIDAVFDPLRKRGVWLSALLSASALFFVSGHFLSKVQWTHPTGKPLSVGLAQANIPQMQKFDPAFLTRTLQTYVTLTDEMGDVDLVIWPETAIPDVLDDLDWFKKQLQTRATKQHQDFLVGAFTEDSAGHYYNTLVGIPESVGQHRKVHLVPFGEYMPLRPIVNLFAGMIDIPMSDLTPGSIDQVSPVVHGVKVGASICYEADFARDIRQTLPQAGFLVNVSNDSWFGNSLAPHQNLQMAEVRALEFGRPMIRATNTGISAFINAQGMVTSHIGVEEQGILVGEVQPYAGDTPFFRLQSWPIIVFGIVLIALAWIRKRR